MKIIMVYDQIQSGLGAEDDTMVPLTEEKEPIDSAIMMEPFLKQVDGHVAACLCCDSGIYLVNPEEVSRKLCAMVSKLQPGVVMCGPTFNYTGYAVMCAKVACNIGAATNAEAFAAMSMENADTITAYEDKVVIMETPKKGGMGLNGALKNVCTMVRALTDGEDIAGLKSAFCFR